MKTFILLALALCTINCPGQTNLSGSGGLFSIPCLDIRVPPAADHPSADDQKSSAESPQLALAPPAARSAPPVESPNASVFNPKYVALSMPSRASEDFVQDSFRTDLDRALYQRLDRAGYFTRAPMISRNALDRGIDNIFDPEVFRLGKTTVSCSIFTAIKRKTPLCLANPIFLNISW